MEFLQNERNETSSQGTESNNNNNYMNNVYEDYDEEDEDDNNMMDEIPEQTDEEVKKMLLNRLRRMQSNGEKLPKKCSMKMSREEIEDIYGSVQYNRRARTSIKFYKQVYYFLTWGVEKAALKFGKGYIRLKDWSDGVAANMDSYDSIFEEIYEEHPDALGNLDPLIKLAVMTIASAFVYHANAPQNVPDNDDELINLLIDKIESKPSLMNKLSMKFENRQNHNYQQQFEQNYQQNNYQPVQISPFSPPEYHPPAQPYISPKRNPTPQKKPPTPVPSYDPRGENDITETISKSPVQSITVTPILRPPSASDLPIPTFDQQPDEGLKISLPSSSWNIDEATSSSTKPKRTRRTRKTTTNLNNDETSSNNNDNNGIVVF